MSTKMLIDARHEEETRVTIVRGSRVEEFDYENIARKQLKGSIYLARVTRVEPSLQAAFVEYGGNRHGFLAFSEIHPDYYQIPMEDREALRQEMLAQVERMTQEERAREAGEESDEDEEDTGTSSRSSRSRSSSRRTSSRTRRSSSRTKDQEASASDEDTEIADDAGDENSADAASDDVATDADTDTDASGDTAPVDDEPVAVAQEAVADQNAESDAPSESNEDDSGDKDGDVLAEDTGTEDDRESVSEELDENTDAAAANDEAENGDSLPGSSGLITLEEPIVDNDGESLEETVAEALAASANWTGEKAESSVDASESDAEEETTEAKPSRRRAPRRSRSTRSRSSAKKEAETAETDSADEAETAEPEGDASETAETKPANDREIIEAIVRRRMLKAMRRRYSIQEVIKKRQIILVQVAKEERGNKGAALTTYISLAGRYCVLMPNSTHSGGVSRKISSASDRRRLKTIINDLHMPADMGLIIRTAGMTRTKAEIKRDYDYLLRLWNDIRELTLSSVAPTLIYEEADLIRRSIRDMYTRDVEEIQVEGERGYRAAKDFMKLLVPSHTKKVQHYNDRIPLFHRYQVESQLESMYQPSVSLKSGGYVVINPTEALISIDVNSGRSTKEHNIEETALKTNLEAAEEIARQLRLRDMAGLVVIDFIDMEDRSNIRAVEKRMKDAVKSDRARIQIGRISTFGLMEMSRQRLRPNLLEASTVECPHCKGAGIVLSLEAAALQALRKLEEEGIRERSVAAAIHCHPEVATYLLNSKREALVKLEHAYGFKISVTADVSRGAGDIELTRSAGTPQIPSASGRHQIQPDLEDTDIDDTDAEVSDETAADSEVDAEDSVATDDQKPRRRRRRRRRPRRREEGSEEQASSDDEANDDVNDGDDASDAEASASDAGASEESNTGEDGGSYRSRRRRGSRGGRSRRSSSSADEPKNDDIVEDDSNANGEDAVTADDEDTSATDASEGAADEAATEEVAAEIKTEASEASAESDSSDGEDTSTESEEAPEAEADVQSEPETAAPAPKQPVSSVELEVKMVSAGDSEKPKKKGWWSR